MSKVKNSDFIFLSAYLRAKEAKMLTHEAMENLITGGSFADAARTLSECGYEDMSDYDSRGVEEALTRHRNAELQDVASVSNRMELVDLFRLPYDYHNAKVLVKTAGQHQNTRNIYSSAGRISVDELTRAYEEEDYSGLPELLVAGLQEALSAIATTQNPQLADMILDHAYFDEMLRLAVSTRDHFIIGYVRLLIDNANLRCLVRSLRMERKVDFLQQALIPGGTVAVEAILERLAEKHSFADLFESTTLRQAAVIGEKSVKGGALTDFELTADNAMTAYLNGAGQITYGAGPVIAYLSALENQTSALRMILTGWLMSIPADTIRERLRDSNA